MENGVDVVGDEHLVGEVKPASEDGGLNLGLVNGDADSSHEMKDESKDCEENEVFEEAIDAESFHMPHRCEQSDSQGAVAVNGEKCGEVLGKENGEFTVDRFDGPFDAQVNVGSCEEKEFVASEKFHESPKVQLDGVSSEEQAAVRSDKFHEPRKVVVDDGSPEEQSTAGYEKFHNSPEVQVNDGSPEEQATAGYEKFHDSPEVQVNDGSPEEQATAGYDGGPEDQAALSNEFHLSDSALANGGSSEGNGAVESHAFHEPTDAQVVDQILLEQESSDLEEPFEELIAAFEDEYSKEVVQTDLCGIEADGVIADVKERISVLVDGEERNPEDAGKVLAEGNSRDIKFDVPNSDDSFIASHLKTESGGSVSVIYDESPCLVTESKDQIPHEDRAENIQLSQERIDNGIQTAFSASAATEARSIHSNVTNGIEEPPRYNGTEIEKESVLVEDMGESSSSDEETPILAQPPPAAASLPVNSAGPSLPSRPAGLGSSVPPLEPAIRSIQQPRANGSVSQRQPQPMEEPAPDELEENRETREKLQMIRVKFLRLAHRLGQTPHNVVVAQVLYRLGLAEQLWGNTNRAGVFSYDRASVMAEQLEAAGQDPLDFSCTIMVIGKSGVGKSATINSIFDEAKFHTDAFQLGTKKVQAIEGTVQGIKITVIDTPGLSSSTSDQYRNEKVLHSIKSFISKTPPDIVLYFDRLDMQSRDFGDVPLLRTITDIFGASIWFNAIVVLTHAASAPPDGSSGTPLSYEMFVTQRSHVVQQAIRQAAGDVRLMNPISLVENHSACRMNRAGQRVLPNGQVWKPQLLLLSFASKILAEANMLLKLQDSPPGRPFGPRARVPPLPFLLSSLLQSRPQLKLPEEEIGDEDAIDEDLDDATDSGDESEDYDELPPFKRLTKSQLAKLSKAQRKAYLEELEYREKLFFKKQLKEEKKRRKMMKKMESVKDLPNDYNNENLEDESSGPASVPVPMPDLVLPTSFDSDYPSHRYRFLDSSSQWLVRPVLETQGWDHDVGYEGLNVERLFVVKDKIPVSVSGQLTKDKKDCNLQMELGTSIKHSEGKSTSLGLDVQTVGKDMAYTIRGETRFKNFRRNNTAAGLSVNLLGDAMSAGVKIEDKLIVNKRFRLLMSGGAMTGRGDVAYGGRFEATLRDKDYPLGRALSTLALSIVDWHGDLAIGCNVQSQVPLGRGTNLIGHANLSNRGSGQVGIRINSSEHLELVLLALIPIFSNAKRWLFGSSQSM